MSIPKRFIRIWRGNRSMPPIFEKWWSEFKEIHPDYEFITIGNKMDLKIPDNLKEIMNCCDTYSGQSNVIRLVALYSMGGIYVDTDIMPIKSFDPLLQNVNPFIGQRSSKSFESAVIGSPKGHEAVKYLMDKMPEWYNSLKDKSKTVPLGPAFISNYWFGREDVVHLPSKTFYPYNGFMAPKREEKIKLFNKKEFPPEMYAAHFSNHRWGGRPDVFID